MIQKIKILAKNIVYEIKIKYLFIFVLLAVAGGVYFNSLRGGFIFDDYYEVQNNYRIRSIKNVIKDSYDSYLRNDRSSKAFVARPVTYLSFAINYYFSGKNPYGYHLTNVILHMLCAVLVFLFVQKILKLVYDTQLTNDKNNNLETEITAFITSLFFAVHPVNTEPVNYIWQRSEILAGIFYISGMILFIKAMEMVNPKQEKRDSSPAGLRMTPLKLSYFLSHAFYLLSLLCYVLGILSKPMAVSMPAAVLVTDWILISDYDIKKLKNHWKYHLFYWIILAGYGLFRIVQFGGIGDVYGDTANKWTPFSYFIIQPYVVLRYIQMLIVPQGLCIDHLIQPAESLSDIRIWLPIAFLAVAGFAIVAIYREMKNSKAVKIILYFVLWFFIALSPASSVIPIGEAMTDRRMYVSGIGLLVVISMLYIFVFRVIIRNSVEKRAKKVYTAILFSVFLVHITSLSAVSIKRNMMYKNEILLWKEAVKNYPENLRAYYSLITELMKKQDLEKAVYEYKKAETIEPLTASDCLLMGDIHKRMNDYNKALGCYIKALDKNGKSLIAYNNIGLIYSAIGDNQKAFSSFSEALKICPYESTLYLNRGGAYREMGDIKNAIADYEKAISLNPYDPSAYLERGMLYSSIDEEDKAYSDFKNCLLLDPENEKALLNMADLCLNSGKFSEALEYYNKALDVNPNNSETYFGRGNARYLLNELSKALDDYNKAIEINPAHAEAYSNRGNIYSMYGNFNKALENFNTAIRLKPDYLSAYYNRALVYFKMGNIKSLQEDIKIMKGMEYKNVPRYVKFINDAEEKIKNSTKKGRNNK